MLIYSFASIIQFYIYMSNIQNASNTIKNTSSVIYYLCVLNKEPHLAKPRFLKIIIGLM